LMHKYVVPGSRSNEAFQSLANSYETAGKGAIREAIQV
jgi:hypothetical protein